MKDATMSSSTLHGPVAGPGHSDRLATTARDRRLERRVLVHLVRRGREARRRGAPKAPPPRCHAPIDGPGRRDETGVGACAVSLADFLAGEYAAVSLDQKRVVAELAVEVAQRIAEELPAAPVRSEVG
jgi:hypothetical protein